MVKETPTDLIRFYQLPMLLSVTSIIIIALLSYASISVRHNVIVYRYSAKLPNAITFAVYLLQCVNSYSMLLSQSKQWISCYSKHQLFHSR